jgi:hypothetical protein
MRWIDNPGDAVNGYNSYLPDCGEMVTWTFHLANSLRSNLGWERMYYSVRENPDNPAYQQYDSNGNRVWMPAVRYKVAKDFFCFSTLLPYFPLRNDAGVVTRGFYKHSSVFWSPRTEWLESNCKGRYFRTDWVIDFELLDDALAFDLVWGTEAVGLGSYDDFEL